MVAGGWILFCDALAAHYVTNPVERTDVSLVKGLGFVLGSGGIFYLMLRSWRKRWEAEAAQRESAEAASQAAGEKLRRSEEQLRLVLEGSEDGFWDWNLKTGGVYCSPRHAEITGYPPGEAGSCMELMRQLVHPEDWPALSAALDQHLADPKGRVSVEFRIVTQGGGVKWVWGRGKVVARSAAGVPLRMLGTLSDITERKQTERVLAEEQSLKRAIIDSTPDMIWSVEAREFGLQMFNRSLEEYFREHRGMQLQAGQRPEELFPGTDTDFIEWWKTHYRRALASGPFTTEYEAYSGTTTLLLTFNPLQRGETVFGVSVFGQDITERKRLMMELEASRQASERLLSCIVRINACPNLAAALECLMQQAVDLGGMKGGAIYLLEGAEAVLKHQVGWAPGMAEPMARLPLEGGWVKAALDNPREISCVSEPFWERFPAGGNCGQAHCLVLMAFEQPFGFMTVVGRRTPPPRTSDLEAVRILALETGFLFMRFKIEERYRQVCAEQRIILDNSPVAVSFVRDRKVLWCNRTHDRLLGYNDGESVGWSTSAFYAAKQDYDRVTREGYGQLAQGGVYSAEVELKRKDGSRFWGSLTGRQVEAENPAGGSIWILSDTTERRRAAEALKESLNRQTDVSLQSEERWARMFANIPIPAALTRRADGRFVDANESFFRMSGFTREEVLGRTALELKMYPDPGKRALIMEQLQQDEQVHGCEQGFQTKSGQIRDQLLWLDVVSVNDEPCVLVILLDITEQKKAEQQRRQLEERLQQSQKLDALGTLAGGIAHDFNNILGAIISFAEVAKLDHTEDAELQENLGEVLKASRRATDLVRQILSFSRQQKLERKLLQTAPIVKEALKLLQATLPAGIRLEPAIAGNLPSVLAEPTQIYQVVMNLCTNAAQAIPGGEGRVRVQLDGWRRPAAEPGFNMELPAGEYVRLIVRDTGCGMNEATRKRMFEPFFTTKGPGEGTGLGLSVVHGIVKELGGEIAVESQPGEGTTLTVCLPAHSAPGDPEAEPGAGIPPGQGERIYFVDDEAALGEATRKMLERLGYQPRVFSQATAAWTAFQSQPGDCDLLVCDLTMPGMTGVELAKRVLKLRRDLPVILTSGNAGPLTPGEIQAAGIGQLLNKPLNYQMLGRAIHQALREPARPPQA
jgi:PAS domain S-box-containing protein